MKKEDMFERCTHCGIDEASEFDTNLCFGCHAEQVAIWEKEAREMEKYYRRNAL